jgi:diguanylate cyclase (GGDEF)-like protein
VLQGNWHERSFFYGQALLGVAGLGAGVVIAGYWFFISGWWVPSLPAILGLAISTGFCMLFHEQDLHRMVLVDELTQVANRRYFEQQLMKHIQRKGELALILCDVDFFKLYNDTYGHQAGDRCLTQVAQTLKSCLRRADLVARYGGEEFVIILPDASLAAAEAVAERVLQRIRKLHLPHMGSKVSDRVTVSCGVATLTLDHPQLQMTEQVAHGLVEQADKALYQAKTEGRDRYKVMVK